MIRVTRRDDHYPNGTVVRHVAYGPAAEVARLHALGLCWPPFHCVHYSEASVRGFGPVAGEYGPREAEIEATLDHAATPRQGVDPAASFLLRTYGPPRGSSCGS